MSGLSHFTRSARPSALVSLVLVLVVVVVVAVVAVAVVAVEWLYARPTACASARGAWATQHELAATGTLTAMTDPWPYSTSSKSSSKFLALFLVVFESSILELFVTLFHCLLKLSIFNLAN